MASTKLRSVIALPVSVWLSVQTCTSGGGDVERESMGDPFVDI